MSSTIRNEYLEKLRCPLSGGRLTYRNGMLHTMDGSHAYSISSSGIPLLIPDVISDDTAKQIQHYDDTFAIQYSKNLSYPHTQEYMAYLDQCLMKETSSTDLSEIAELCCGQGELLKLFGDRIEFGVGIDASVPMLESGRRTLNTDQHFLFVNGDATKLPLGTNEFGSVFMLGGVHHVSDRAALFSEVHRILRPGGKFFFREPVSDFFLWRWLRSAIYRLSPALDAETERPLLFRETVPLLEAAGFELVTWKTYGFLGFCLFMNSDVLVFNRLFRFLPGIRALTRIAIGFDDWLGTVPGFGRAGLQVIGVASKPMDAGR